MIARARRWLAPVAVAVTLAIALGGSTPARADAVDEAFARGHEAAAAGDWTGAIEAYEQADALLPEPSGVLSYDLGTAHLHAGNLGPATFHLRRSLDWRGGPTAEVVEAARVNLAAARRRAELAASEQSAKIDRPGNWDLIVEALVAPGVGWSALVAGWLALLALWIRSRRRRRDQATGPVLGATLILLVSVFVLLGTLHGLALRADQNSPEAIVLAPLVEARDGAGNHRPISFRIQGGARVRVLGKSPGWRHVRLPGGLEGWVPEDTIGTLGDKAARDRTTGRSAGAAPADP